LPADITVAIAHIPPRVEFLTEAVRSVAAQTLPAAGIVVATDTEHEGAPATRNRALAMVRTEWTAWLDDDDVFYARHLARLRGCAEDTGADYVYSYWDTRRTANYFGSPPRYHGPDEHYGHYGHAFDPANPTHTTMTILVRTELARAVGFTPRPESDIVSGEDWRFTEGCVRAGARIVHLPEQTWFWRHHETAPGSGVLANTSGRGDRW
jgi:hypothetical protein